MADYRIKMADKSRTPLAGEQLRLSNNDQVEIYRKPPTKDRPGWVGPASVTDTTELSHGKVTVRWQGRHITVPLESVRRAMIYLVWLTEATYNTHVDGLPTGALAYLLDFVECIRGSSITLGWLLQGSPPRWQFTNAARKHRDAYHALLHVASNHLHLTGCIAGVCSHGVQRLPPLSSGAVGSVIMHWYSDDRDGMVYSQFDDTNAVSIERDLDQPRNWHRLYSVQFHLYDKAHIEQLREEDSATPQLGGHSQDNNPQPPSPIVRTPITVTDSPPSSLGQPASSHNDDGDGDGNDDDNQTDISDEVFWQEWLAECRSELAEDSRTQRSACHPDQSSSRAERSAYIHDWSCLHALSVPPDPTYYLTPSHFGYEHLHLHTQLNSRVIVQSPQHSQHQRKVDRDLKHMQSKLQPQDVDYNKLIYNQQSCKYQCH